MIFFVRLKAFLKALAVFINNLPRKHFFALVILFVFLLIISFMPSQVATKKTIKRQLVLPTTVTKPDGNAMAEPLSGVKEGHGKVLSDYSEELKKLAAKLIAQETLEGKALDDTFEEMGLPAPEKEVKETKIPAPVKPVGEAEKAPKPKKAPGVPRLVPKQTPAAPD